VQTFGSVAHLHPHLHVLMTDGGFRRDGTFVALPTPEPAVLEEAWRRGVLAKRVRRGWLEQDAAAGMLGWPHSGFGAYLGPPIRDRAGLLRVARYSARAPVSEGRLRYDAECAAVELVADRVDGPYAGVHRMAALEFIARWLDHVPERYEVRVRYAGAYATRRRVWWRGRGVELVAAPAATTLSPEPARDWPALRARRRRWAELLRLVFQVEVEVCPRCGGAARIVGFVTEPAVVRRILAHLEWRAGWRRGPGRGRTRRRRGEVRRAAAKQGGSGRASEWRAGEGRDRGSGGAPRGPAGLARRGWRHSRDGARPAVRAGAMGPGANSCWGGRPEGPGFGPVRMQVPILRHWSRTVNTGGVGEAACPNRGSPRGRWIPPGNAEAAPRQGRPVETQAGELALTPRVKRGVDSP